MWKIIKKILSITERIIMMLSGFVIILSWFHIQPPEKLPPIFYKLINALFFKIPLIWAVFAVSIILYFVNKKKHPEVDKRVCSKKDIELTKDHKVTLLFLLNKPDCSYSRYVLEEEYRKTLEKDVADFNILRQDLLDGDLVDEISSFRGVFWKLTNKGLRIAQDLHKELVK